MLSFRVYINGGHKRLTSSMEPHFGQAVRAESIPWGSSTENNKSHEEQFFFITLLDVFSFNSSLIPSESEISPIKSEIRS